MKKLIVIYSLFFSIVAFSQDPITKNLGDFTQLKVYNGIEVELIKSKEHKLEITGKKANDVTVKNVNGTLKLMLPFSVKPENNAANGEALVKLFFNKDIDIIDANEGAAITGKNINQKKIEIKAQERAFINLTLTTEYLTVKASSGGIIKLTGKAISQEIDVDLYGTYHGFNLKVDGDTIVRSGTGAKAEIYTDKKLNAKVSFGGSIFYKGSPEIVKDKKVIGGIIKKMN